MNHASYSHPVILVADHKWRDLPGMALLKIILEEVHKLPAVVVGYGAIGASLQRFRPRAVVLTTLISPREQKIAQAAHAIGAAVAVIPTEGIPGSTEDMIGMMRGQEFWQACDLYLPWGPAMGDFAVKMGYLVDSKVCVTGSARFDFYQPPLRRHLTTREDLGRRYRLRDTSPIVTWATTFIMASYLDDEKRLKMNERDFERRGLSNTPGYANLPRLAAKEKRARDLVIRWVPQVCREFSDAEFLFKPHPYETFEAYERLQDECRKQGIQNFHLISNEYIWDVLNSAALHIHSGSTTGLEAWIMALPTLNVRPGGYARFRGAKGGALPELDILDDCVDDNKMLAERIGYYLNGGSVESILMKQRRGFLEQWFSKLDGSAAIRQAEAIATLIKIMKHKPNKRPPFIGKRTPLYLLQYRVNELLGRYFDAPWLQLPGRVHVDAWGQRDKVVRQSDVALWAKKIRSLQNGSENTFRS